MQTLAKAGELSLKFPRDVTKEALGHKSSKKSLRALASRTSSEGPSSDRAPSRALSIVARNDPATDVFVEQFMRKCALTVKQKKGMVDDKQLDELRGILSALKEEGQATALLKRESEDRQAGQALQATRASVAQREKACEAQEKKFLEREAGLREQVERHKSVLVLMETNIEKGDRKTKEEQAECRRLDAEIRTVEREIQEHEAGRTAEETQIARAAGHKAFLERVVQERESDFEGDVKVLINRYKTLDKERQGLTESKKYLDIRSNQLREESLKDQTAWQTEQMMSSSRLHELQVLLEKLRVENVERELRLNRVLAEKEERKSQVGITKMAIEQLFTRIVESCRLKQRKEAMLAEVESKDKKFAPVRLGAKADPRLESRLNQIIARVKDLRDMADKLRFVLEEHRRNIQVEVFDEGDILARVTFVNPDRHLHDGPDLPEASSSQVSSELAIGGPSGQRKVIPGTALDGKT